MYKFEFDENGTVLITNAETNYAANWLADSFEAAERKCVELSQPDLLQALADYRFSFEVAGLTLESGLRILTDRESQAQLANSYTSLKNGLIPDTDWKTANGWRIGDLAEIEPIAKAMAAHVRACFRGERVAAETINAAVTMTDIRAISIPELFDTAYQSAFDEVTGPAA